MSAVLRAEVMVKNFKHRVWCDVVFTMEKNFKHCVWCDSVHNVV